MRDDRALGAPNVYRVTAKALRAAGFATVEAMRAAVAGVVTAEEEMQLRVDPDAVYGGVVSRSPWPHDRGPIPLRVVRHVMGRWVHEAAKERVAAAKKRRCRRCPSRR